jgi:serine/threonine-protein kinase
LVVRGPNDQPFVLRRLDSLEWEPLPGTHGAQNPFFSPDGKWIGYWQEGELRRLPVTADVKTYTTIARVPGQSDTSVRGASWGDGDVIVFATVEGLWRVAASGGTPQVVKERRADEPSPRLPHVLPGGQAVLFTLANTPFRWDDAQIVVRSLASGDEKVLIADAADARYMSSGHIVFMRQGKLMAAPFDLARLALTGGAVAVVDDVMQSVRMPNTNNDSGAGQFTASEEGTLIYVTGGMAPDAPREIVWVDRRGTVVPIAGAPKREYSSPRLSPDGKRLVVFTEGSAGSEGSRVWIYDIPRGTLTPLTAPQERAVWGVWSPDSTRILFQSGSAGGQMAWKSADGVGNSEIVTAGAQSGPQGPSSWSSDGKIAYVQQGPTRTSDILVMDLDGGRRVRPAVQTGAREGFPDFSPDGKWLAFASDESGRAEVFVQPDPGPGQRIQVSTAGGSDPAWSRDGSELFYLAPAEGRPAMTRMMAVTVTPASSGLSFGIPRQLFEGRFGTSAPVRSYDVSVDGQRFLMISRGLVDPAAAPAPNVVLVHNWFEELKRLVPTK